MKYLSGRGCTLPVVIDAEDSDVLGLSSYATTQIPIHIYIYRHGRLCNCAKLFSDKISKIILQLHFFTRADCTSSFFDHGKSSLLPLLTTISVIPKLNGLGDNLPIEQHLLQDLENIAKAYIYMGEARAIKHNLLKTKTIAKIVKIDG